MGRNISIAISAKDNFSTAITSMRNSGMHFSKDLEQMQKQLVEINKNRVTLKLDTDDAKKNLQALQKEYQQAKKSGDGMISDDLLKRLDEANEAYEQARRNLGLLDKAARDTEKSMANAGGAFAKLENRAGSSAKDGLLSALAASGLADMAKELSTSVAKAYVASAYGSEASTLFSNTLSGASSGAAAGTMLSGVGVGTAIGAAAGAGIGLANGYLNIAGQEDEAFKSAVQEQYSTIANSRSAMLQSGVSIASQREVDNIAFTSLLKGEKNAKNYLEWVKNTANRTPFLYDDLKTMSKTLATYGYSPEEMQERLIQIGDTGANLGMSTADMSMVATGLGRMRSSGKTSLEYLNILIERGIPAIDYLAEAMGATKAEVYEMVSRGMIPGAQAADALADAMGRANSGAMDAISKTLSGLESTKQGLEQELANAMGEGFAVERKGGLELQNAFLDPDSETGKKMQEAYGMIGAFQAELENQREESWRNTLTAVMDGNISDKFDDETKARLQNMHEEYMDAARLDDRAKMGEILAQVEAEAEAEYRESEAYKQYEASERGIVERLQSAMVDSWESYGYNMGLAFSKGRAAAMGGIAESLFEDLNARYEAGDLSETEYLGLYPMGDYAAYKNAHAPGAPYAYGLGYVPYDNFPALLHEGERVLTASEARAGREIAPVTVTGNNFVVREEADIYKIAQELARQLKNAAMLS